MKRISKHGMILYFGLVLASAALLAATGAADLTEVQKEAWAKAQESLRRDDAVCREHCGGNQACLDKCDSSYQAKLDRAYQAVLYESNPADAVARDIQMHPACSYCGMDRAKFAHARIFVTYGDGSTLGTCSIHCAALDMAVKIDKTPVTISVGDFETHELIDAEKAVWTLGGDQTGVMTTRAKWAFGSREAAERYAASHGGGVATFEQVIEAAYEDMYKDTKVIREKRKNMRMMKMKEPE